MTSTSSLRARPLTARRARPPDRHPGPGPRPAPGARTAPPRPPRGRSASSTTLVITLGDPVAGPRRPRRPRHGAPDRPRSAARPHGSAPSTSRWNQFGTPPRSCPATAPRPGHVARPGERRPRLAARQRGGLRPHRRPRSTTSSWSTARSSRRATPAPCCSASGSATSRPRSAAWSPSASRTARSPTSPPRSPATAGTPGRRHAHARPGLAQGRRERRPRRSTCGDVADDRRRASADGWTRLTVAGLRPGAAGPAPRPRPGRRHRPPGLRGQRRRRRRAAPRWPTRSMVDAVSGEVLHRRTRSSNDNDVDPFQGAITADRVRPEAPLRAHRRQRPGRSSAPRDARQPGQRHRRQALRPGGDLLVSGDTGTSPETATYSRRRRIPAGHLHACRSARSTRRPCRSCRRATTPARSSTSPTRRRRRRRPSLPDPRWRYFPANPSLDSRPSHDADATRVVGCWIARPTGCTAPTGALAQRRGARPVGHAHGSRRADPHHRSATTPTPARRGPARSPPAAPAQAPISPTREYTDAFTDAWNNSKCDPAAARPRAATTSTPR